MSPEMHFEHMNYTIVIIVMSLVRNIDVSKTREYKKPFWVVTSEKKEGSCVTGRQSN